MRDDASLQNDYLDAGDQCAFQMLVNRHLHLVYNASRRQMTEAFADEISQDVFIRLARKARSLRGHSCLVGWLHTTTRFVTKEVQRREFRRRRKEEEAQRMNELHDNSCESVDWKALQPVIDDVLAQLSEVDRMAVLLRFFENKPLAEVGGRLRISQNAARVRIDRALEKLQSRLTRYGIRSTASALTIALTQQTGFTAGPTLSAAICHGAFSIAPTSTLTAMLLNLSTFMTATKTTALVAASLALIAFSTAI